MSSIPTPRHYNFNTTTPETEARIDVLLGRMTLEEKVGQTVQVNVNTANQAEMEARLRRGQLGSILSIFETETINRLQKIAVEESRLGIPLLIGADVIQGLWTIFPMPLAWASTWELALVEKATRIAAEEATAQGIHWTFTPMVDITRDPRWGRIAEGAGEDPCLGAAMAAAQVRGFQSELPNGRRMATCPKHYAGYGWAEAGRDYNGTDISERTLRDVILPPFKAAFDAGAGSVMSAFNDLNGIPASANPFTLRRILRDEWGFKGVVLSDWNSIGELIPHGFAADLKDAAKLAFLAGVDIDMVSDAYHHHLADLVRNGAVPGSRLNETVRNVLRLKFALGLFERHQTDLGEAKAVQRKPEALETALEVATKSLVLLKNEEHLLPIDVAKIKRLAVIGPLADSRIPILGAWSWNGFGGDGESILDGLKQVLPATVELVHVAGCDTMGKTEPDIASAVSAAGSADLVILTIGESAFMCGEAHSRAHLGLPGHQQALLEACHATGVPVVVVLVTGRPLVIPWLAEHLSSILVTWHGGSRGGRAVADVLVGRANPSGKLTATWPRSEGQIPIYHAYKNTGRPYDGPGTRQFEMVGRSVYLDEYSTPQFPFGFGRSYTTFEYSELKVLTPTARADANVSVEVMVANTGARPGDEIVQLYVRDRVASVTRPVKQLKGFRRISLMPGEVQRVRFDISVQDLGFHGVDMRYTVEPGLFDVWVGPNAVEGLAGAFEILA